MAKLRPYYAWVIHNICWIFRNSNSAGVSQSNIMDARIPSGLGDNYGYSAVASLVLVVDIIEQEISLSVTE